MLIKYFKSYQSSIIHFHMATILEIKKNSLVFCMF